MAVDSGSNATLLSKDSFDKMEGESTVDLHQKSIIFQGVDGKNINVHGYAYINISFDESHVLHTVIITLLHTGSRFSAGTAQSLA